MLRKNLLTNVEVVTHDDMMRRSGRSLGLALLALSIAIREPGRRVPLIDHHGTKLADVYLAGMVRQIVEALELKHIMISNIMGNCYVQSNHVV